MTGKNCKHALLIFSHSWLWKRLFIFCAWFLIKMARNSSSNTRTFFNAITVLRDWNEWRVISPPVNPSPRSSNTKHPKLTSLGVMGTAFLMFPTRSIIHYTNGPLMLISFSDSSCKIWCPHLILEAVKDQNSQDTWELVMPKVEILYWATSWFYPSTLSYQF